MKLLKGIFLKDGLHYHFMLLPGLVLIFLMQIYPLFGIQLAFKQYNLGLGIWGSHWVGLDQFRNLIENDYTYQIIKNTIVIAVLKMIAGLIVPVVFALVLNELRKMWFKRTVQTIVYLPHFLSWVILAAIIKDMFSLDGIINKLCGLFGAEPVMFLGSNHWFLSILIATDTWKEFGFSTIIYLAALTGINPTLYEAAMMDGATRWHKLKHITMPGITATIVLLGTLSLQNVLNAGFDQVFNLYNKLVYPSADIIDTYVYRVGLEQMQFELATAVGLFKSVISFILIIVAYRLAARYANYRIF